MKTGHVENSVGRRFVRKCFNMPCLFFGIHLALKGKKQVAIILRLCYNMYACLEGEA